MRVGGVFPQTPPDILEYKNINKMIDNKQIKRLEKNPTFKKLLAEAPKALESRASKVVGDLFDYSKLEISEETYTTTEGEVKPYIAVYHDGTMLTSLDRLFFFDGTLAKQAGITEKPNFYEGVTAEMSRGEILEALMDRKGSFKVVAKGLNRFGGNSYIYENVE